MVGVIHISARIDGAVGDTTGWIGVWIVARLHARAANVVSHLLVAVEVVEKQTCLPGGAGRHDAGVVSYLCVRGRLQENVDGRREAREGGLT